MNTSDKQTARPLLDYQVVMQQALTNVRNSGLPIRDDAELYRLACADLAAEIINLRMRVSDHA